MTRAQALQATFRRFGQPRDGDTFCEWVRRLDYHACVAKTGPAELLVIFSDRSLIGFDMDSIDDCGTVHTVH